MKNTISTIAAVIIVLFSANTIQANSIKTEISTIEDVDSSQLQTVYDAYFTVKDALIKKRCEVNFGESHRFIGRNYCRKNG